MTTLAHSLRRLAIGALAAAALVALTAAPAQARAQSLKKAIWGPSTPEAFNTYVSLGAGIYETKLNWQNAAPTRPRSPRDFHDSAYQWPAALDQTVSLAAASHMRVLLQVSGAPPWANGGHSRVYAPTHARDYADFVAAAARRYPGVRMWMIWGEPSGPNFRFRGERGEHRGRPLNAAQRVWPHRYANLLDAAYGALKGVNRSNIVVGGNTYTTGAISPLNWIKNLRLPNGQVPRMDLYGHNPFTSRKPNFHNRALGLGFADFSDLPRLAGWLDRYLRPRSGVPRHIKVFVSEFFAPTDHKNTEFNFWVDRPVAADWLRAALKLTRSTSRIYSLGWFSLYDDPPNGHGTEVNRGLLDVHGNQKPAYAAYRDG